MPRFFSIKARLSAGAATLVLQVVILLILIRGLDLESGSYAADVAAEVGFLLATALVFAGWAVAGPGVGWIAIGLTLTTIASSHRIVPGLVNGVGLILPAIAAVRYRARLLALHNRRRRALEEGTDQLRELEMATEQTRSKLEALGCRVARTPALRRACQALGSTLETDEVRYVTVREAATVLHVAERAVLLLKNGQEGELAVCAAYPVLDVQQPQAARAQEADRFVFERGKSYLCPRTSGDIFRFTDDEPGPVASFASAPVWLHGSLASHDGSRHCVGVLRVTSAKENAFTRRDIEALNIVATLAGMSMQNASLYEQCKRLAIHDQATGLHTPDYFAERLREEFNRSAREKAPLSLWLARIDGLDAYRRRWGGDEADRLLRQIAQRLRATSQSGDLLVRYDDAVIGALRQTDHANACAWADRVRDDIEQAQLGADRGPAPLTLRTGVATSPDHGAKADEIVAHAQEAIEQAGTGHAC